jgi:protein SCO1/2
MSSKIVWRTVYIATAAVVAAVLIFTTARPVVVLPRIRLAPGYALLDSAGRTVSSEDQRGKLVLYSFAYTRCGEACQPVYDSLQAIDAHLAARSPREPDLRLITLTLDPTRDTPTGLSNFQMPFQPPRVEWVWLTGEEKWLKNVIGGSFEVLYEPQDDGSIFFAPRFILVDGEGVVRAIYEGAVHDAARFSQHLDLLYQEIEQAAGPARLAYEAAHLFACYPH